MSSVFFYPPPPSPLSQPRLAVFALSRAPAQTRGGGGGGVEEEEEEEEEESFIQS